MSSRPAKHRHCLLTTCLNVHNNVMEQFRRSGFAYNVSVRGHNKIFRYGNQHASWRCPGHRDEHHKHLFDWRTGDELADSPLWIGADGWPTLHEVVDEARDWHAANRDALDAPDDFPPNLQSVLRT